MFEINEVQPWLMALTGKAIIEYTLIYAGGMNHVYELTLGGRKLMLKVYPALRSAIAEKEFQILKKAKAHGVLVPAVLGFRKQTAAGYLLYEPVTGHPLNFGALTAEQQNVCCTTIVDNLKSLATVTYERYGSVTDDEGLYADWPEFLLSTIEYGLGELRALKDFSPGTLDVLAVFLRSHAILKRDVQPNLVWGDMKAENILVAGNTLSALIDFESGFSGDPLLTLGYFYAREGNSYFYRRLAEAYREIREFDESEVYFYAMIRLLRISPYLNSPLPTGLQREPVLTYFKGIQEVINLINPSYE